VSDVWVGRVGSQQYYTEVQEHAEGLLIRQETVYGHGEDEQVLLGPEALEAIKEWLEDNE
jgi:hypothetical protein